MSFSELVILIVKIIFAIPVAIFYSIIIALSGYIILYCGIFLIVKTLKKIHKTWKSKSLKEALDASGSLIMGFLGLLLIGYLYYLYPSLDSILEFLKNYL